MSFSKAKPRKQIHSRNIVCHGYLREDGLWDIEGSILDTKTYFFENIDRDGIAPGEPIHHMTIRLTVDNNLVIRSIEASTSSSPYLICPDAVKVYSKLKGLQIGPGWRREMKKRIGASNGCTHISDLIVGPLAVTAYQTIIPKIQKKSGKTQKSRKKPLHINRCHALKDSSPIVKRDWPEYYQKPQNYKLAASKKC